MNMDAAGIHAVPTGAAGAVSGPAAMHSDESVMERVRAGQMRELAILFERYQVRLFNFFLRLTGSRPVAEDRLKEGESTLDLVFGIFRMGKPPHRQPHLGHRHPGYVRIAEKGEDGMVKGRAGEFDLSPRGHLSVPGDDSAEDLPLPFKELPLLFLRISLTFFIQKLFKHNFTIDSYDEQRLSGF
jgi:hypothetical protein